MKYKVWVEIEEIDEDKDRYENVSSFPVCVGVYDTLEDADKCVIELTGDSSL